MWGEKLLGVDLGSLTVVLVLLMLLSLLDKIHLSTLEKQNLFAKIKKKNNVWNII